MADPWSTVLHHDPHDDTTTDHLLQLLHIENPTLADLYQADYQIISSNDEIGDPCHPIHDPVVWSVVGQSVGSGFSGGANGSGHDPTVVGNFGIDSRKLLTVWPDEPPVPYSCSFCQVLREIIHTDGNNSMKLEIHGRVGFISHAILESRGMHIGQQYQMFDFSNKSHEDVKEFLEVYFKERWQAGYILMSDPLSNFYDALCVGLATDRYGDGLADDIFESSIASSESGNEEPMTPTPDRPKAESGGNNKGKNPNPNKPSLSIQRARLGKMNVVDFAPYFHLPIEEAARRLNICPTVIKKICRRDGLRRWPHRKIKSIDFKVSNLKKSYEQATSVQEKQHYLEEIQKKQQRIDDICFGVPRAS